MTDKNSQQNISPQQNTDIQQNNCPQQNSSIQQNAKDSKNSVNQTSTPKQPKNTKKQMTAIGLSMMVFTCVWGFGNITNGFGYFEGTKSIIPWIAVFVLYFLPYSLMVGEMGSTFKDKIGGVASWVFETIGPKVAFFCGWIYWIVHMPYLSQRPNNIVISFNWVIFQDGSVSNYPVWAVQAVGLVIFIAGLFVATKGIKVINVVSSVAGWGSFIMGILYIVLVWAAPVIKGTQLNPVEFKLENFMPQDLSCVFNLSVLIFAVGGCEKIAPYVNDMKNPTKQFPRGMMMSMIMVMISCILGTVAMGMMYGDNIPDDFLTNGQFEAFAILGQYYGVGNFFVVIFALSNLITLIAVLIISIDAPLKIMLGNADRNFFPSKMFKTNKHGCYINGIILEGIIVSILIIVPMLGIGDVDSLVQWLIKLNSVVMPLRYLFVFAAYIALKKNYEKFANGGYQFVKSKVLGMIVGGWCFAVTLICCIMGMYNPDPFMLVTNVVTPIVLLGIGLIMPYLAKREKRLAADK